MVNIRVVLTYLFLIAITKMALLSILSEDNDIITLLVILIIIVIIVVRACADQRLFVRACTAWMHGYQDSHECHTSQFLSLSLCNFCMSSSRLSSSKVVRNQNKKIQQRYNTRYMSHWCNLTQSQICDRV